MTRRRFLWATAGAAADPRAEWAERRRRTLENMQSVMGPLPHRAKPPLAVQEIERVELPGFTRLKISYRSEGDDRVPAYLLIPRGRRGRVPAMLCLHQSTRIGKQEPAGLGGKPDLHYAKELSERGYVTLAPDYPSFGEYKVDPYAMGYASATMKGIWNHMRAVDLLESLPEVAGDRIGSIGHSLGGHNTLFVASFDERVRALVSSCGFNRFAKHHAGDITAWSHKGYMPRIAEVYANDPTKVPFDFPELLAALAPRPVFINAPLRDAPDFEVSGVKDCVAVAMPVYAKVFRAAERLVAVYPDAGHEFPTAVRQAAYQFLDRWLRR